ncbi:MAG TPA: hypothetical protein VFM45_08440 [Anaeromyxobacteraceae bacterium]|nr:hypothetical protein [Anaeromyxobacteraceae bacterium]
MGRKVLWLGGAIFLVGGAAVAWLLFMPEGSGFLDLGGSATPAPAAAPSMGALPMKDGRPVIVVPEMTTPAPAPTYEPAPPPPPAGTWEAVRPSARLAALGAPGAAVARGLNEMRDDLDACFDEDAQSRHGREAVSRARDAAPNDQPDTTILMLQLESRYDTVVLVDAPVESQGLASDGLVACVQKVLRGLEFQAPGMKPGQRFRVPYTVSQ